MTNLEKDLITILKDIENRLNNLSEKMNNQQVETKDKINDIVVKLDELSNKPKNWSVRY